MWREEDFLWDAETENLADGYKNGLKRFLYRTLSKVTGQKLPWGNLTGIRPTKIAYGMLDEGRSDAEILDFMEQSHYVSEEKALLGIDIAKRERNLLKEIHYEGGYSLYIRDPVLPYNLSLLFLYLLSDRSFRRQVDAYVDAVIKEMDYVAENFQDKVLDTVYIGGGTPTTLEPEQLDRLITALKSKFDFLYREGIHCGSRSCRQHHQREAGGTASSPGQPYLRESPDYEAGDPGYHRQKSQRGTGNYGISAGERGRI